MTVWIGNFAACREYGFEEKDEKMTDKGKNVDSVKNDLIFLLLKAGMFAALLAVTFWFVFGIYRCSDDVMSPAFKDGDLVVYYRMQKQYHPSDTVVIEKNEKKQIRRIVAGAGDQVDMTEEGLKINGNLQQEKGIFCEIFPLEGGIMFPVTIGEGEYFVLGDNRIKAEDSRIYGVVSNREIQGSVITLIRRRGL